MLIHHTWENNSVIPPSSNFVDGGNFNFVDSNDSQPEVSGSNFNLE